MTKSDCRVILHENRACNRETRRFIRRDKASDSFLSAFHAYHLRSPRNCRANMFRLSHSRPKVCKLCAHVPFLPEFIGQSADRITSFPRVTSSNNLCCSGPASIQLSLSPIYSNNTAPPDGDVCGNRRSNNG